MSRGYRLVYVAGLGHSGTTLLDVLLASHSRAVGIGEAMRFSPGRGLAMSCTCAAGEVWDCGFWRRVDERLARAGAPGLREIDLSSDDAERFRAHNVAFYDALYALTGCPVLVDSSKDLSRLARLLETPLDVLPVHLLREPHGVVYSYARKGRPWLSTALRYNRHRRKARRLLGGREHVALRYEELASDPAGVLARVMPRVGLVYEPGQLEWAGRERHNCGGNRMRRASSSAIRRDDAWRRGLSPPRRWAISLLTGTWGG
jgi:hypothetical protein